MEADVLRGHVLDRTQRVLKTFIEEYRSSPELWDPRNDHYSDKYRRVAAQDRLLTILKLIHADATRIDVRKKINTFRSNYNKKAGMVKAAELEGREYVPKSWLYHELRFLETIKRPDSQIDESTELEEACESIEEITDDMTDQIKYEITYPDPGNYVEVEEDQEIVQEMPENEILLRVDKKQKLNPVVVQSVDKGFQRRMKTKAGLRRTDRPNIRLKSANSFTGIEPIALVWSSKLRALQPAQRLVAEKAINDILFEASLNNLQKGPMVINATVSSVSFAEADDFPVEVHEEYVGYGSSDDRDE